MCWFLNSNASAKLFTANNPYYRQRSRSNFYQRSQGHRKGFLRLPQAILQGQIRAGNENYGVQARKKIHQVHWRGIGLARETLNMRSNNFQRCHLLWIEARERSREMEQVCEGMSSSSSSWRKENTILFRPVFHLRDSANMARIYINLHYMISTSRDLTNLKHRERRGLAMKSLAIASMESVWSYSKQKIW